MRAIQHYKVFNISVHKHGIYSIIKALNLGVTKPVTYSIIIKY